MGEIDSEKKKKLSGLLLLKKNSKGLPAPVVKIDQFPCRFHYEGKVYIIEPTKKNSGLIMKTE